MAIYRGEENIKALYRGGSPIARAYVGGTLVYQRPTSATMKKTLFQSLVPKATATEISFLPKTDTDLAGFSKIGVVDDDGWIEVWNSGTKYKVVSHLIICPDTCGSLFYQYTHATTIDLTNFNTSNVTITSDMFHDCRALTTVNLTGLNTANVTNMSSMFSFCVSLTTVNLANFYTVKVTDMRWMFKGCTSLTTITSNTFNKSALTRSDEMFKDCSVLVGGNGTTYDSDYVDATYARVDTTETPGYFTAPTE